MVVITAPAALHRGRGTKDRVGGRGPHRDIAAGSGGSGVRFPREPVGVTFLHKGHLSNVPE